MADKRLFVALYRPPRADFIQSATAAESAVIGRHYEYLKTLLAAGDLVLAGPCEDAAFGISIFRAESAEAAASIVASDPAVIERVFTVSVHPFRMSLREK